jgi:hypothetical protein
VVRSGLLRHNAWCVGGLAREAMGDISCAQGMWPQPCATAAPPGGAALPFCLLAAGASRSPAGLIGRGRAVGTFAAVCPIISPDCTDFRQGFVDGWQMLSYTVKPTSSQHSGTAEADASATRDLIAGLPRGGAHPVPPGALRELW